MTNSDERSPPAVGVYWINEDDYPELLKIFPDGNRMPRTWAEWLKIAEEMESGSPGIRARHHACSHRSEHISGLVRRPWHECGQSRTQEVRS